MTTKYKHRRRVANRTQAKLSHDLRKAKYDAGLHNRLGHGALPLRRPKPPEITLPDPWRH